MTRIVIFLIAILPFFGNATLRTSSFRKVESSCEDALRGIGTSKIELLTLKRDMGRRLNVESVDLLTLDGVSLKSPRSEVKASKARLDDFDYVVLRENNRTAGVGDELRKVNTRSRLDSVLLLSKNILPSRKRVVTLDPAESNLWDGVKSVLVSYHDVGFVSKNSAQSPNEFSIEDFSAVTGLKTFRVTQGGARRRSIGMEVRVLNDSTSFSFKTLGETDSLVFLAAWRLNLPIRLEKMPNGYYKGVITSSNTKNRGRVPEAMAIGDGYEIVGMSSGPKASAVFDRYELDIVVRDSRNNQFSLSSETADDGIALLTYLAVDGQVKIVSSGQAHFSTVPQDLTAQGSSRRIRAPRMRFQY